MTLYTVGFTQKSAERFFSLIREHRIGLLLDIRLNNKSQLAGFTKGDDLRYFLSEICRCGYRHALEYAPTKELLTGYQRGDFDWAEYARRYAALMDDRGLSRAFPDEYAAHERVCLLCSEPTPERCHRGLLAEMIARARPQVQVVHL